MRVFLSNSKGWNFHSFSPRLIQRSKLWMRIVWSFRTSAVNFITVLCDRFSYKILAPKITKLKVTREKLREVLLYEKFAQKTLMKLTPGSFTLSGSWAMFPGRIMAIGVRDTTRSAPGNGRMAPEKVPLTLANIGTDLERVYRLC